MKPGVVLATVNMLFAARFRDGKSEFVQRNNQAVLPLVTLLDTSARHIETQAAQRNRGNPGTYPALTTGYGKACVEHFIAALYSEIEDMRRGGTLLFAPRDSIKALREEQVLAAGYWFDTGQPNSMLNAIDALISKAACDDQVQVREHIRQRQAWSWSETHGQLLRADINGLAEPLGRVEQALKSIGAKSTVDGAVIIDEHLRVHAFGVKLQPAKPCPDEVMHFQLRMGEETIWKDAVQKGTRHRSAIATTTAYPETIAAVFSADGGNRTSYWDTERKETCLAIQDL